MNIRFTHTFTNLFQLDTVSLANVAAVDVTPCVEERQHAGDVDSVCSDVSAIASVGVITRTIITTMTPEFLLKFPTDLMREQAVRGMFRSRLEMGYPGPCAAVIELDVACP